MTHRDDQVNFGKIAIVGLAAHYPQSENADQFWENLCAERNCITFHNDAELARAGVSAEFISRTDYVKANGVYPNQYSFDALLFGYSAREAQLIDPQHRIFLESAWEALEHAGYDASRYRGRIGVFAGSGHSQYMQELLSVPKLWELTDGFNLAVCNEKDFLATRVGYKLDLRGPCVTVQTACSSSLVSIIFGCQSLLTYQSDLVLAGGVSLDLGSSLGYIYREGSVLSPDGFCRAFDASARGTVPSSGAGVVVLKRLDEALADRDTIHAVILGFGMNNDGAARVGFTAPGLDGQVSVYTDAILMANVNPETIGYVECHGTGTPIGDPLEVAALSKAFRAHTKKQQFCAIGSAKTNIGHTDAAAGVAGFIKTVLVLKNRKIPASLHFSEPNPEIQFEESPFFVNTRTRDWTHSDGPRRAATTSLGLGGTNAHVILEEPPQEAPVSGSDKPQLLVWSAQTVSALDRLTAKLLQYLRANKTIPISDVAYTLQVGRKTLPCRRYLVCRDALDAIKQLEASPEALFTCVRSPKDRGQQPLVFLFPGQGSQYLAMGRAIYQADPAFRQDVDRCAEILQPELGINLAGVLYPAAERADEGQKLLDQTQYTQPALFVVEYCLARLWMRWGVRPKAMLGHSIGEYVAALLAGVFSFETALKLVAVRGRLMQQVAGGTMLSVFLSEQDVRGWLDALPGLSLAAVNGPQACVVSGTVSAVQELQHQLEQKGISCRMLRTSHAFHSQMMDSVLDEFRREVCKTRLLPPQIPYISNVTGRWISASEAQDPEYWVKHLRQTVRFFDGIREVSNNGIRTYLEVGPGNTLSSLARPHLASLIPHLAVHSLVPRQGDGHDDLETLLHAAGKLWAETEIVFDWPQLHFKDKRRRIPLPGYPFERHDYHLAADHKSGSSPSLNTSSAAKDLSDYFHVPVWRRTVPPSPAVPGEPLCWALFFDSCDIGTEIASHLRNAGHDVFVINAGSDFQQHDAHSFTVSPANHDDFRQLWQALAVQGKNPTRIVYLWTLSHEEHQPDKLNSLYEILEKSFYGLACLGASLRCLPPVPVNLTVISNGAVDVAGEGVAWPAKATLDGPCKTIPFEYPQMICRSIDISLPSDWHERSVLVTNLLAELNGPSTSGSIAYRSQYRWVKDFEHWHLSSVPSQQSALRPHGVYLITGGLGGLGLTFARYFATICPVKLALVSRSLFPPRAEWELHADDSAPQISEKIRQLRQIEQSGSELMVLNADVCNPEEMKNAIFEVRQHFGEINGVIHTAGIAGGSILEFSKRQEQTAILSPKIKGTLVLAQLLEPASMDFFILCSSLTAIQGGAGQAAYTAANAFLDAFAHSRHGFLPQRVASINWNGWKEIGMRADYLARIKNRAGQQTASHNEDLEDVISPSEGCELLKRILCNLSLPQVAISRFRLYREGSPLKAIEKWNDSPCGTFNCNVVRSNLSTAYVAPRTRLEEAICEIWSRILGIEQVGIHDDFTELGGHSLIAIQLVDRLRQLLDVELTVADVYRLPTVAGLSEAALQSFALSLDSESSGAVTS